MAPYTFSSSYAPDVSDEKLQGQLHNILFSHMHGLHEEEDHAVIRIRHYSKHTHSLYKLGTRDAKHIAKSSL